MIPTTVAGLLVIVLALLPGVPGDRVYRLIAGVSWREKQFDFVLRLLLFSTAGLALYSVLSAATGWSPPRYVVPSTFAGESFNVADLPPLGAAYLGHLALATVVGAAVGGLKRAIGSRFAASAHRDAWDHFIEFCVPRHWVVLTLKSGESFLGMIDHADIGAEPENRDIILSEPAEYNAITGEYTNSTKQMMFIRARDVASIATIFDPQKDERLTPPETVVLRG